MLLGGLVSFEFSLQMWCIAQRNDDILDIDYVNYSPNYHFSNLGMIGYYTQEDRQLLFDKGASIEEIKSKTEALKQASYKIAEELYKQQGAAGAQPGAGAGPDMGGAAGGDAGANAGSSSGFNKGNADDVEYEVHDDK